MYHLEARIHQGSVAQRSERRIDNAEVTSVRASRQRGPCKSGCMVRFPSDPPQEFRFSEEKLNSAAWSKFLSAVHQARVDLRCEWSGAWYRGVTNHKWRLYPALLRPRSRISLKHERSIFEEAEDFDAAAAAQQMSSWERLVQLQHHGTPTRLLDWTETFGAALYFALGGLGSIAPRSPAVWVMNPFRLAQLSRKSNDKRIGVFHRDRNTDYYSHFLAGAQLTWPFQTPMPYRPPKLDPRIRAQRGFFTIHGTDVRPLDAIFRECVRQIRVPQDALPNARQFLDLAGIDSLALFPDHEGFSKRLRERYE